MAESATKSGILILPYVDTGSGFAYPVFDFGIDGEASLVSEGVGLQGTGAGLTGVSETRRVETEGVPKGAASSPAPPTGQGAFEEELVRAGLDGLEHELISFASRHLQYPFRVNGHFVVRDGAAAESLLTRAGMLPGCLDRGLVPSAAALVAAVKLYMVFERVDEALDLLNRIPEHSPETLYLFGILLYRTGRYDEAARVGREALEGFQPTASVRYLLAAVLNRLGKADEALAEASQAFSFLHDDRFFLEFFLETAKLVGDRTAVVRALEGLLRLSPGDTDLRASLAGILYEEGFLQRAGTLYGSLRKGQGGERGQYAFRYAICLASGGARVRAADILKEIFPSFPADAGLSALLLACLERGERDPNVKILLATEYLQQGDVASCRQMLETVPVAEQQGGRVRLVRAECALLERQWEEALEILQSDGEWSEALAGERDFFSGVAFYSLERYQDAEGAFRATPADSSHKGMVDFYLGELLYATGRYRESVSHLQRAIRANCRRDRAVIRLAYAAMAGSMLLISIEAFSEVLRIDPDYIDAYNNLGIIYARQDRLDDAVVILKEGLERAPEDKALHHNLSLVYERILKRESREHYQRYLEL